MSAPEVRHPIPPWYLVQQCWCGSNPDLTANAVEVDSSECNLDCAGTSSGETCGGIDKISVYTISSGIDDELTYVGCYGDARPGRAMSAVGKHVSSSMTNKARTIYPSLHCFHFALWSASNSEKKPPFVCPLTICPKRWCVLSLINGKPRAVPDGEL